MIPEQLDGKSSLKKTPPNLLPIKYSWIPVKKIMIPKICFGGSFLYNPLLFFFRCLALTWKKKHKTSRRPIIPLCDAKAENCVANDDILRGFESLSQGLPMIDQPDGQVGSKTSNRGSRRLPNQRFFGCCVWYCWSNQKNDRSFFGGDFQVMRSA